VGKAKSFASGGGDKEKKGSGEGDKEKKGPAKSKTIK